MDDTGNQPAGFRGPVAGFSALTEVGGGGPRLCLPRLCLPQPGVTLETVAREQPCSRAVVEVRDFTESMGTVESAMQRFTSLLQPGGTLVLDFENAQSLRQLRTVVEGRPGSFDPAGSLIDPSRPLSLRRVLQAAEAAGLAVDDVVAVPVPRDDVRPGFAAAMFDQGLVPLGWLDGPPPLRYWLVCSKRSQLAGTVLIAGGAGEGRAATEAAVRALLPGEWEVLVLDGGECAAWTAGIAEARGELLWFLRGGARVSEQLFSELSLVAAITAAAPADVNGRRCCPGDLSGVMLPRSEALVAGPLPRQRNTRVALEDWCMRLESAIGDFAFATGEFSTPAAPVESPATFAAEAGELLRRWEALDDRRGVRADEVTGSEPAVSESETPGAPGVAARPAATWPSGAPRITLCMIARDEQRFLGECLRRAVPAVDEIVVVDTGSTDDTVAIAQSFGAVVLHRPWDDDFSAPRNMGLAAATGDWILVLDADEFLTDGSAERIRQLARDGAVAGYHMRFTNHYTGGKTVGVMMVRMFRRLPGIAYENVIHEQITPSLVARGRELGLRLASSDIEVEHHGYREDVMDDRRKNERNERLFQKQLQQHPDDPYSLYKYGDFLRRVPGRDADAQALLLRCLELILAGPPSAPRELPYAGEVAALCAIEYVRGDRLEQAIDVVDTALRRLLPTPNLHYVAANLMLASGHPDAAIAHFRRCLGYRGQVLVVPIQEGITGHVSLVGIARALEAKGDLERGRRLCERAVELAPDYEVGHMVLSRLQLRAGRPQAALVTMTDYLAAHPESPGACHQTTLILQRLGCTDQARRMGERALGLLQRNGAAGEAARMQEILAAL